MDLMNIVKIAAILAAVILVRIGVQMLLRRQDASRGLTRILPFILPPMITGGPMFLALPVAVAVMGDSSVSPLFVYLAFGGAVLLGLGLAGLLVLLSQQQRQIDELRLMIAPAGGSQ